MKRATPKPEAGTPVVSADDHRIEITVDGPYMVYGRVPMRCRTIENDENGNSWDYTVGEIDYCGDKTTVALCRCGQSKNAPYCDGSHIGATERGDWTSELTASHTPPLNRADELEGPDLLLTDVEELCAFARFCDAKGRTWALVEQSDEFEKRNLAIRTAQACPAGRLKVWDRDSGEPLEPQYDPELAFIEDPTIRVSGPIFVMGGIPIFDPEGIAYQPRNRVTLCRCGQSRNKPFCDGTHSPAHYHDKIPIR